MHGKKEDLMIKNQSDKVNRLRLQTIDTRVPNRSVTLFAWQNVAHLYRFAVNQKIFKTHRTLDQPVYPFYYQNQHNDNGSCTKNSLKKKRHECRYGDLRIKINRFAPTDVGHKHLVNRLVMEPSFTLQLGMLEIVTIVDFLVPSVLLGYKVHSIHFVHPYIFQSKNAF